MLIIKIFLICLSLIFVNANLDTKADDSFITDNLYRENELRKHDLIVEKVKNQQTVVKKNGNHENANFQRERNVLSYNEEKRNNHGIQVKDHLSERLSDSRSESRDIEIRKIKSDEKFLSSHRREVEDENRRITDNNRRLNDNNRRLNDNNRRITDNNRRVTDNNRRVTDNNRRLTDNNRRVTDNNRRITDNNRRVTDNNRRITDNNRRVTDNNRRVVLSDNLEIKIRRVDNDRAKFERLLENQLNKIDGHVNERTIQRVTKGENKYIEESDEKRLTRENRSNVNNRVSTDENKRLIENQPNKNDYRLNNRQESLQNIKNRIRRNSESIINWNEINERHRLETRILGNGKLQNRDSDSMSRNYKMVDNEIRLGFNNKLFEPDLIEKPISKFDCSTLMLTAISSYLTIAIPKKQISCYVNQFKKTLPF